MIPGPPPQHGYMGAGSATNHGYANSPAHQFDQTGQIAPPGMKPRVTATLWEDEGSLCYQVEAKGVCVARREGMTIYAAPSCERRADRCMLADNHMINGTKLLNVAGMTRGRRDGILKSEKLRHVVKIGPMHLKGVWLVTGAPAQQRKLTFLIFEDSVCSSARLCEQGKDHRQSLPPLRP